MKNIVLFFSIALFVGLITVVGSCSSEGFTEGEKQDVKVWHSAKLKLNVLRKNFDITGDRKHAPARAEVTNWKDGDVIWLLLVNKDGNKVQAYVKYDGASQKWGNVMFEGYKSDFICNEERVAEAYFIEGCKDINEEALSFDASAAIYSCTDGSYIYPADGEMTVNVTLVPLTGRIRFEGVANSDFKVDGIKTYTSFSRSTGQFVSSTASVEATVGDNGSTPYIYSVFADTNAPSLIVVSDGTYKAVFDPSSTILKPGKSGFLSVPSVSDHRGWIIPVMGVSFDKDNYQIVKNETLILQASITPQNATDMSLKWESSDETVATVDNTGKVTAKGYGEAVITATAVSNESVKATCTVTVGYDVKYEANGVSFILKYVRPGTFMMGSESTPESKPVHSVTLSKGYLIGETEVTQKLWKAVTGENAGWSANLGLGDQYPVYNVSYEDVQSFITKLNSITGLTFRMPTEAEWEYAARGGIYNEGYIYSGSNDIKAVAWYKDNSGSSANPVKKKNPNALGLYDMSGNVSELVSDWYGIYSSYSQIDPTGPETGRIRICRGGNYRVGVNYCTCTYRQNVSSSQSMVIGFRLALNAD